ncbi:hypothetical protein Pla163_09410 [Planctomycetes bacterium Pla163]|uniref:HTH arsR-type domain-containing protein n=1 Tax=Rohdeia mirabilis TaxID=2528008 RepID=A0A518CX93_9BACT|nr:hypothetical protein Pla163_09410 [Planctomycetes bacterium Pla163]
MPSSKEIRVDASRQVRALASPLRQRFVDVLTSEGPCSVRDVAERLGKPPATLYYHLRLLEDAGIVRTVGERATGKRPEMLYEAISTRFRVDNASGDRAWQNELERYVRVHLRDVERAIAAQVEDPSYSRDDPAPLMHFRAVQLRLNEQDRRELAARVEALTAFLIEADGRAGVDEVPLSFALAMAPSRD